MFGAFRPSAPLSGGLLWKTPWKLSAPRKLRQRRRLRKVDNVVATLANALQNRAAATLSQTFQSPTSDQSATSNLEPPSQTSSLPTESSSTKSTITVPPNLRRHGKGPKQGDFLPNTNKERLLSDEARENGTIRLIERWKAEMPREEEMLAKDKYTIFDKKVRGYRKGVHKLPKWTRVSQRVNPPGF